MFGEDDMLDADRAPFGSDVTEGTGCVAPAADSVRKELQPPVAGPPRPVGLGAFWESEQRWKAFGLAASDGGTADDNAPCTEARPCAVQDSDPDLGKTFDGSEVGVYGWKEATRPRGVRGDDHSFDAVDKEFVHASHDNNIGGIISAWCRGPNSKVVCLAS